MDDIRYMIENLESRRNAVREEIDRVRRRVARPGPYQDPTLRKRIEYLEALRKKLNAAIEKLLYQRAQFNG
jgi:prefoldin subunit 5